MVGDSVAIRSPPIAKADPHKNEMDKATGISVKSSSIFMKNSPLITTLMVAACVLSAAVLALAAVYESHYRALRTIQPKLAYAQNAQNIVNALAMDAVEYSKHNPAIDPILVGAGLKPGSAAAAPATRPASK